MIVDGKRVFLKKLWLALLGSKFSELRVKYDVNGLGIRWQRDNAMICVSLFCKREKIFETIFWIAGTQNQVPERVFPLKIL